MKVTIRSNTILPLILLYPCLLIAQPLKPVEPTYTYSLNGHIEDGGEYAAHGEAHGVLYGTGYDGKVNSCLAFSKTNQYISLPVSFDGKAFSISFWMYPEQQQKASILLSQRENFDRQGWQIVLKAYHDCFESWDFEGSGIYDENMHFRGYHNRRWGKLYDNWYHVCMTYTPEDRLRFYFNGVLIRETKSFEGLERFAASAPVIIGNYPPNIPARTHQPFKGRIDQIQVYATSLTTKQVEQQFFRDSWDLSSVWDFTNTWIRTSGLEEVYLTNRREQKSVKQIQPIVRLFYPRPVADSRISQALGERTFNNKPRWQDYNENKQTFSVWFPAFDTVKFRIAPEDLFEEEKMYEDLHFLHPRFRGQRGDTLQLTSLEMHIGETGKRFIYRADSTDTQQKPFYISLEQLSDKLETGVTVKNQKAIIPNIIFETGKYELQAASRKSLDQLWEFLNKHTEISIDISGHTDNTGSPASNLQLSADRAGAVRAYLIEKGIEAGRLIFGGYGDTQPVESNDSTVGRQKNRRVVIEVIEAKP